MFCCHCYFNCSAFSVLFVFLLFSFLTSLGFQLISFLLLFVFPLLSFLFGISIVWLSFCTWSFHCSAFFFFFFFSTFHFSALFSTAKHYKPEKTDTEAATGIPDNFFIQRRELQVTNNFMLIKSHCYHRLKVR